MVSAQVLLRFWWTLPRFCWDSGGICMDSFSILMGYAWNCLGNSDGFYVYSDGLLLDSALPCVFMAGGVAQRRSEASATIWCCQGVHASLMWGSDVRLWCWSVLLCGLVKEPWLSFVSEWSSHMVLWCFLLISKCLLLGSDCVVVGLHGVLWVECLWDGFLLTPGSGCSTALCCWASEPANLCTADLSLCTPTFGVLSRSISWISKSC
jgi:hypothetical protein